MALNPVRTNRNSCFDMIRQSKTSIINNNDIDKSQEYIDSFNGLEITEVYKNFDYTKTYRMEISEGSFIKDKYPHKQFWVSPEYGEVIFERGDYVTFKYANRMCTFIIEAIDNQYTYLAKGRMYSCNNILNLIDEYGELHQYPIVFNDKVQRANFDFANSVNTQEGLVELDVKMDNYTDKIKVNDRFIFDSKPYKVTYVGNHNNNYYDLHSGIVTLQLAIASEDKDDDLENNIANSSNISIYEIHSDRYIIEDNIESNGHINVWVTKDGITIDEPLEYEIIQNEIIKEENTCDIRCYYPYSSCNKNIIKEEIIKVNDNLDYETINVGECKVKVWMKNNHSKFVIIDFIIKDKPVIVDDIVTIEIEPKVESIRKGQTLNFKCTKYINGEITNEILNVIDNSTIKTGYYILEGSNNEFSITCLKEHRSKKVEIEVSDNDGHSEIMSISLIGLW